jgi:hypothetical protein
MGMNFFTRHAISSGTFVVGSTSANARIKTAVIIEPGYNLAPLNCTAEANAIVSM